jgi:hypothetical protein
MKQFSLTTAAGKRLIGKGIAAHPEVLAALKDKTVVVIAGTTNGYVAQELLAVIGQADEFRRVVLFCRLPDRRLRPAGFLTKAISRAMW